MTNTKHWQAKGPGTKPSWGDVACARAGFLASAAIAMVLEVGGSSCRNQQPGSLACVAMDVHPEAVGDRAESCLLGAGSMVAACSQPPPATSSAPVRKQGVTNA